jgi:two-component system, cell cycle sensor histidine kinase PleC
VIASSEDVPLTDTVVDQTTFPRTMSLAVHELRTPVTVVAGYLRMLLREQGGPLTDKQRKMLEEAERSCGRISALVAEMSELGKLESGELALQRQDFDLGALVAELASGMHEGSDRGVRLETRGTDRQAMVTGDRTRIGAAIGALMHSALRERGDPGVVTVQCSENGDNGHRWAVVAIGDASSVPSLANRRPEDTASFDEWRGGLGMALPVARRVIEAHGGALWSASRTESRAASGLRLPLK